MKRLTKLFSILGVTLMIGGFFLFNQLQVGNITVGLSFPCACITSKNLVQMQMYQIEKTLNEYYQEKSEYPNYEELIKILESENGTRITAIFNGRQITSRKQGVYYIVSKDQQRYEIQGYATATWNGIPIVINIERGLPQDAYTIDG